MITTYLYATISVFIVSLISLVGVFTLSMEVFVQSLLPIAAGRFLYIAIADLIPELHKTKEKAQFILQTGMTVLGVLLMLALTLVE